LRQYAFPKFRDFPLEKCIPIIFDHYKHAQFSKMKDADHSRTPKPSSSASFTAAKKLYIFAQNNSKLLHFLKQKEEITRGFSINLEMYLSCR